MMIAHNCLYIKNHWIINFKWMNGIQWKLHVIKAIKIKKSSNSTLSTFSPKWLHVSQSCSYHPIRVLHSTYQSCNIIFVITWLNVYLPHQAVSSNRTQTMCVEVHHYNSTFILLPALNIHHLLAVYAQCFLCSRHCS